jgi:hypothetical protein
MEEDVLAGKHDPPEHWYSPISNAFALLNPFWKYVHDIPELILRLRQSVGQGDCIKELRIHSHGNRGIIRMGNDDLREGDFDANGRLINQVKQNMLNALKQLLCKPAKITFDACNRGSPLLQNISKYLGPDVTVNGFNGTGNPITGGDLSYVNGVQQPRR